MNRSLSLSTIQSKGSLCDIKPLEVYNEYPIDFYGSTETVHMTSPFYYLFSNDMKQLEHMIKMEFDITKYVYHWKNGTFAVSFALCYCSIHDPITELPNKYINLLWNDLTLLEVAYLLYHEEAIQLLLRYQRRTWEHSSKQITYYKNKGIILATQFGKFDVVERLQVEQQKDDNERILNNSTV